MAKRSGKFNAVRTKVGERTFHSKREAHRFKELQLLERAGKIKDLQLQVPFFLIIHEKYIADFVYYENGQRVVEDVKGYCTAAYRRKRTAMKKQHLIEIRET